MNNPIKAIKEYLTINSNSKITYNFVQATMTEDIYPLGQQNVILLPGLERYEIDLIQTDTTIELHLSPNAREYAADGHPTFKCYREFKPLCVINKIKKEDYVFSYYYKEPILLQGKNGVYLLIQRLG